jgi:VRR-NUC domain
VTEAELQAAVMDLARRYGWITYHVPDSRRVTARGCPDLIMINEAQARVMFAELKAPKGKLRPEQTFWIGVLTAAGIEVHVWRPSDLAEVIPKILRPIKPERRRGDRSIH